MRSSDSSQLKFAFTDSPRREEKTPVSPSDATGGEFERLISELRGREYLQFRANFKETTEADAETVGSDQLLEQVARTPNLARAMLKVSRNKGAPGIDGQSVGEVVDAAHELIPKLRDILLAGRYQPGDIRRVWIPKPGGGERGLGIPTVTGKSTLEQSAFGLC